MSCCIPGSLNAERADCRPVAAGIASGRVITRIFLARTAPLLLLSPLYLIIVCLWPSRVASTDEREKSLALGSSPDSNGCTTVGLYSPRIRPLPQHALLRRSAPLHTQASPLEATSVLAWHRRCEPDTPTQSVYTDQFGVHGPACAGESFATCGSSKNRWSDNLDVPSVVRIDVVVHVAS